MQRRSNDGVPVSFHLHTSNRLDRLADHLASVLRTPSGSPFIPEAIVVQSLGMARWLKLELARRLGVCAHVEFPFPRAFVDRILHRSTPDPDAGPSYDRDTLHWRLFRLLQEPPTDRLFDEVRRYLEGGDRRKRLQLAGRLAHLFDQYLVFRPDLIRAWDEGGSEPDGTWQAALWRQITAETGGTHPARRHAALPDPLPESANDPLPDRIALFGISALPPLYLDVLHRVAQTRDVHCFLLQPCEPWWGDVTTGRERERLLRKSGLRAGDGSELHLESSHRLLESLGPLGRDFIKLIYEQCDAEEHAEFIAPDGNRLLQRVQRGLLELESVEESNRTVVEPDDDSIRLHACHSPIRELEVLRDQLLDWFQKDPTLMPRDVLVMTPDLDTYAPRIQAVFDAPELERERIPYSLTDRGPRQSGQTVETFLHLLRLAHGRAGASEILDLLECAAVRNRFGLVESDLGLIRHWVTDTRIHWGRDAAHRAALGLPPTDPNTWRAGLRRLLLGQAMAPSESGTDAGLFAGILPYDDLEGSSTRVLGRFASFVEHLFSTLGSLEQSRPPVDWIPELLRTLDTFFGTSPGSPSAPASSAGTGSSGGGGDADAELAPVRRAIAGMCPPMESAAVTESVELAVVLEPLTAALEEDTQGSGFLTGGVTFCALKPMRSIPFRVICLLGMNEGSFPRQAPHSSLDLMATAPRLGDRSTRDDDRYLFLETLISAGERLHLSHVGQSERDNRPIPPSVVVSELFDFLDERYTAPGDRGPLSRSLLTVRHRLHAFSPAYFESSGDASRPSPLFSYSEENSIAARTAQQTRIPPGPFLATPLPELPDDRRRVTLQQLGDFLSNPCQFFLRDRFQLDPRRRHDLLEDQEPLLLDSLDSFQLRSDWVSNQLSGLPPDSFVRRLAAEGRIPPGKSGLLEFHEHRLRAENFLRRLGRPNPAERESIEVDVGPFRLVGAGVPQADGSLLQFRCGRRRAADTLRLWIQHLAWQLARPAGGFPGSRLVTEDFTVQFSPVNDPQAALRTLLDLYWLGLRQPLRLFPKTASALVNAERAEKSRSKKSPLEQARPVWEGDERSKTEPECEDPAFRLCFRHEADPLNEEFITLARAVFGPIHEHSREEKA